MQGRFGIALLLLAASAPGLSLQPAAAQQAPDPASLNSTERLGQKLFYQSCGVCHTKPQITSKQFGPVLSMVSAGGREDVMRDVISNGTPRMPGFKHHFDAGQIAAIVTYLKKLPEPPPEGGQPR
jgi:mono/diheme cytochrome c family protein